MSQRHARIRVSKSRTTGRWYWVCSNHRPMPRWACSRPTWREALSEGLDHLVAWHQSPTGPGSAGQIQINTRCTCSDGPRLSYPHFSVCPVHAQLFNAGQATSTLLTFASGSLRDERGEPVLEDPDGLSGPQSAAHAIGAGG